MRPWVTSDRGAVEAARLNFEFTEIHAPVDGKTGPILLQPGNLVSVNGSTAPLVMLAQIQPIKVSFNLPQSDLPRIQARATKGGLTAQVNLHEAARARARPPRRPPRVARAAWAGGPCQRRSILSAMPSPAPAPSNCAPRFPTRTARWCPAS